MTDITEMASLCRETLERECVDSWRMGSEDQYDGEVPITNQWVGNYVQTLV